MSFTGDPLLNSETAVKRILVVDDSQDILIIVGNVLRKAGYEACLAASGNDALDIVQRKGLPHLAVVDINMPYMNGFELCRRLRKLGELPIIMLTAQSHEQTVIDALDEFADDYIVKPFGPRELVARIERVLRRVDDFDYTFDSEAEIDHRLRIDFSTRQATVDGQQVTLTPTETKILYILMRQDGRIVPTETLLRHVWPFEAVPEERLRVHVSRLRRKIKKSTTTGDYIVSERGTGYRLRTNGNATV